MRKSEIRPLQSSSGNILDDEALISTLETSKAAAETVKQARRGAGDPGRHPRRGVLLFFATQAMAAVEAAYQPSLRYFLDLFMRSLEAAVPVELLPVRPAGIAASET